MELKGKTALVTGGSRGLGKAIAERLASAGAIVAVNYAGNREAAEATVAGIEAAGGEAIAMPLDVTNSSAVNACIQRCVDELGALDVLANVAGILRIEHADRITDEDWNESDSVSSTTIVFGSNDIRNK